MRRRSACAPARRGIPAARKRMNRSRRRIRTNGTIPGHRHELRRVLRPRGYGRPLSHFLRGGRSRGFTQRNTQRAASMAVPSGIFRAGPVFLRFVLLEFLPEPETAIPGGRSCRNQRKNLCSHGFRTLTGAAEPKPETAGGQAIRNLYFFTL